MRAQTQWQTFLRESPAYPGEGFAGRGIVILAGGLTYMVPAWVNVHMLRRTGEIECMRVMGLQIMDFWYAASLSVVLVWAIMTASSVGTLAAKGFCKLFA